MSADRPPAARTAAPASARAQTTVRRILVCGILFALMVVAAVGLVGLVDRLLSAGAVVAGPDVGLAQSLAFTVIGAPLAALLLWWQLRRLADPAERASVVWALYLAGMLLLSLVLAVFGLAMPIAAAIDGQWLPGDLAAGIVWSAVWLGHRALWRARRAAPTRLPEVPATLGALVGLIVTAGALAAALAEVVDAGMSALLSPVLSPLSGQGAWVTEVAQSLVWAVIGAVVWWWHWWRERARSADGGFASVILVAVVGAAAAVTLFAAGTVLFVVLRVLFDTDPMAERLDPLSGALAAGLIAGIVWVFHADVVRGRAPAVRAGARLVLAGVALIGAASGFGVVVNALLASLTVTLDGDDPRTLLLGGLSALIVGAAAWWPLWRGEADPDAASPGRRVYLVVIFGASAVVAIVTALVIGYRLFESALGSGEALLERVRAPLGLFAATALVFAYHFAIWRRDRIAAPQRRADVDRITLISAGPAEDLAAALRTRTGAKVVLWRAADGEPALTLAHLDEIVDGLARRASGSDGPVAEGEPAPPASHVLVLGGEGGVRLVPLEA